MINISATNRCKLFEAIAQQIWEHVIFNHSAGEDISEIGITKDILACIKTNYYHTQNFGVWASRSLKEIDFGGDLDIFVETQKGRFVWYALQAKALKISGSYDKISSLHGGEYQWEKLERLQNLSGCFAKYLFYNGVENFIYTGNDKCNRLFDQTEFGCSLVDIENIKKISLSITEPKFIDFHPYFAQPWRVIVCCKHDISKVQTYSLEEVQSSVAKRTQIIGNENIVSSTGFIDDNTINILDNLNDEVDRKVEYQIVVRNTTSWQT